jgi:hypothetical protein
MQCDSYGCMYDMRFSVVRRELCRRTHCFRTQSAPGKVMWLIFSILAARCLCRPEMIAAFDFSTLTIPIQVVPLHFPSISIRSCRSYLGMIIFDWKVPLGKVVVKTDPLDSGCDISWHLYVFHLPSGVDRVNTQLCRWKVIEKGDFGRLVSFFIITALETSL